MDSGNTVTLTLYLLWERLIIMQWTNMVFSSNWEYGQIRQKSTENREKQKIRISKNEKTNEMNGFAGMNGIVYIYQWRTKYMKTRYFSHSQRQSADEKWRKKKIKTENMEQHCIWRSVAHSQCQCIMNRYKIKWFVFTWVQLLFRLIKTKDLI